VNSSRPAVIAVASGKGGTGKTTVAAHLAFASAQDRKTLLVDLDVEAPDALGYFPQAKPVGGATSVRIAVPQLLEGQCTGCGRCASSCRFGAILCLGGVVTIDGKICKGCGLCVSACPSAALDEAEIEVGNTAEYSTDALIVLEGRTKVGDIRSTAVIEETKTRAREIDVELQIRDCPPGVSCPATHAIEGADYLVLVAEPTEFSIHDLGAALSLARDGGIPVGVVVNKDGFGKADVARFCRERGAQIIGRLAFSRERAEAGAAAALWTGDAAFMAQMTSLLEHALSEARTMKVAP